MGVEVASKIGHALKRSLGGLSLAQGSMLLRMRRASIALLGLVGGVGLGLVFFISQIGWPGVLSGPLPGAPTRVGTVHDAVALTRPGPATAAVRPTPGRAAQGAGGAARGSGPSVGSRLRHAKRSEGSAGVHPGHGVDQPGSSQPAPEPAPVTPAPAPAAAPTVASSPSSTPSEPVRKGSSSKPSEAAVAKAVSDDSKSTTATATKSQGGKSAKDQASSVASTKSSEASSAKAKRDESVAKTKAKAPPPPSPAPEKSLPAPSPAAAKEAADAAKASQGAH
ncbi:MAG: hypothetical protein ACLGG5_03165 [Thermoleophilia bacterium]